MSKPRRTDKQREIMGLILSAAGDGRYLTQNEIHKLIGYECSYGAVRKSVAFLVEHKLLVKERAGMSVNLVPTQEAYTWFRPGD